MTIKEACEELRTITRGSPSITFARVYGAGGREEFPRLQRILADNGVIRFAMQDFGKRIFHVVHKRLEEVLEDGA